MDFYWSDFHLETNEFFNNLIHTTNDNGYVYTYELLKWGEMKKRNTTESDIIDIAPYSENFELDSLGIKMKKKT